MSKRITTRWYIGAWVVYVLAAIAFLLMARSNQGSSMPPPGALIAYLVLMATGIVMLVMWIGAMIRLGQQRAWGWFAGVLVSHLIGLGIIGMVAYAVAGPPDTEMVVTRPSTPV
jgi:heme/copper-type cytochrome/quinol oxidase subunit 3